MHNQDLVDELTDHFKKGNILPNTIKKKHKSQKVNYEPLKCKPISSVYIEPPTVANNQGYFAWIYEILIGRKN